MPSTIFTRVSSVLAFACALPVAALAGDFPEGCYARAYSEAHLARNPRQSVTQMLVLAEPDPTELLDGQMFLKVQFRGQGIGVENAVPGGWYGQTLYCRVQGGPTPPGWAKGGGIVCFAECDGGAMQIASFTGDKLDLRTGGLFVDEAGGECEGNTLLTAEGQQSVIFRLHPVDLDFCLNG
ncbi:hypothetical protein [Aliiruegeria sabulilitoris]|uniref:hypothetical protein n=1 Tax=Aliiruegeria sabulilitoris TaxID=1510458 RepID=UPI00082F5EF8|nr:hypothetical protein [Aliiruegeria sabulilitoris]NDR59611.1 hypothetical protein [Pseudoruegeria sp. M32A2M]